MTLHPPRYVISIFTGSPGGRHPEAVPFYRGPRGTKNGGLIPPISLNSQLFRQTNGLGVDQRGIYFAYFAYFALPHGKGLGF